MRLNHRATDRFASWSDSWCGLTSERRSYILAEFSKILFCRVCGFRVRVWGSYRTSRSFGYGYESGTELPEVSGIVARAYKTYRSSAYGYECPTEVTEVPGVRVIPAWMHTLSGGSSIWGGGFNPTCVACSYWAHVSQTIWSSFEGVLNYRQNHHRERRSIVNPNEWRPGQQAGFTAVLRWNGSHTSAVTLENK